MKTLHLTIIVGVAAAVIAGNFHNVAAECGNKQDGIIPCDEVDFKASIDKIIYEDSERPLISVLGAPEKILGLTVLDATEHQKFAGTITIGPNGTATYPLNVTSYQYGIYYAVLSDSTGKVVLDFPVALQHSGQIRLYTDKDHYNAGDWIVLSGSTTPLKYIQILLIDPNLTTQYNGTAHSDSNGYFVSKLPLPQFSKSGYWRIRAASEANYMILPIPVGNTEDATDFTSLPPYTYKPGTPLQQIQSGIPVDAILCGVGLQPAKFQQEAPACVRPQTAQVLIARGWTTAVSDTATAGTVTNLSAFKLNLSTDNNLIRSGQKIGIDIAFNNTSAIPLKLMAKDSWSYPGLSLGEQCGRRSPIGIAILHGYYTEQNMTQGKALPIFDIFASFSCAATIWTIQSYVFESSGSHAYESSCNTAGNELSCGGIDNLAAHLEINGTWNDGESRPFEAGVYTLIGGDEWGNLAIQHFTVTNSSEIYTTSISQPTTVQTNDFRGTIYDVAPTTQFTELASGSSGIQIARGGCCRSYDNGSIRLELYHGKRSDSHIIAATVDNVGKRTVHVYGIRISGFIQITNSSGTLNLMVLQDEPNISPKEDAVLEPGESQTKYIVGNWTGIGKQVNGFSAGIDYSYDNLEDYNGMTNGYDMTVPVQWVRH